MQPKMLMLGNQQNSSGKTFPCAYETLDPDGGTYRHDLSDHFETDSLREAFRTVFNLGTIEHIWDAHNAYVNSANMVVLGGHFLGHSPVAGWEGHGIHVTESRFILDFFRLNGFVILDHWLTTAAGNPCAAVIRNGGKSVLLWFVARRDVIVGQWKKPSQVYAKGVKSG